MMDFHHIMMLIHHKLYDSYKLYYCRFGTPVAGVGVIQEEGRPSRVERSHSLPELQCLAIMPVQW